MIPPNNKLQAHSQASSAAICCRWLPTLAVALWLVHTAAAAAQEPADVAKVLSGLVQTQAKAWNRGDIEAFMETYWKSEKLTFSSGGKTQRGWQTTLNGYKNRYPNRKIMGKLTFSELEVQLLGDSAALMLGRWQLDRDDPIGGNFSLVWKKIDSKWLIVHDHTSSDSKSDSGE